MDLFGFKKRALIEKLVDLYGQLQEQYDDARDALNDYLSEEGDGFFDAYESHEDYQERLEMRVYAAATKMELVQERLEALEA